MSLFTAVELAPRDPILGLTEAFNADTNPRKVNLGVGVYLDGNGRVPLLDCVRTSEEAMARDPKPRPYLPMDGMPAYTKAVQALVFGTDSAVADAGRLVTLQTLSGTGALKVGADFLRQVTPARRVVISDPSWENHQALFTRAGLAVDSYRYYDASARGIDVDGMLADLASLDAGTVVLLHACCHNPTGYDLTADEWTRVIAMVAERGLVPFIDMAYQGFSQGIAEDGAIVRRFAEAVPTMLVAVSFSKTLSLYGERVGALSLLCADADEAKRVLSQVKLVVRTNYSNPPTHGAAIAAAVLTDPGLRAQWEQELATMRERIKQMRRGLADGLRAAGVTTDVDYITRQVGMFSYSGLTVEQMVRLRQEFGVYGTDKGRICVAALNEANLDYVSAAVAAVL